jgi:hypothetical protein
MTQLGPARHLAPRDADHWLRYAGVKRAASGLYIGMSAAKHLDRLITEREGMRLETSSPFESTKAR